MVLIASKSLPLRLGAPRSPGRMCKCRTTTSCVAISMPPRINVIPGAGAVCPAIVKNGSVIISVCSCRSITPPTSNTTMRGPVSANAADNEPAPFNASVVTRKIFPPRPPGVCAAQPSAPGNAKVLAPVVSAGFAANTWYVKHALNSNAAALDLQIAEEFFANFS